MSALSRYSRCSEQRYVQSASARAILQPQTILQAAALWIVLVMTVVVGATIPVPAQDVTDGNNAEAQIRSLERAWTVGEARNDNRALDLIFDNALVYIEYGKLMTKGEYLSRIRTSNPHLQQIVNEAITVRTFGSTAIVVGIYREKDVTEGKTVLTRWRFIDTWVNKKGSWLLVAAASAPLPR
jgi:hypothetical protein